MINLTFSNAQPDTNSSPFYNYVSDTIYVGDDSGKLHKFNPVFSGTPAEVTGGSPSWPITVSSNKLTSPVYDSGTSTDIFVADSGGYLYSYTTAGAHVATSSRLAIDTAGILDAPVVDSSTEYVYVFVGQDGNTSTTDGVGCKTSTGCNGVFRFLISTFNAAGTGTGTCNASSATAWSTGTNCGSETTFGTGAAATIFYDGAFDNIYLAGTGTTGNLWACSPKTGTTPRLSYQPIGTFPSGGASYSTVVTAIDHLTSAAATCSPVTEIYGSGGTTNDYIFLSVTANGNVSDNSTCTGACVYNFLVSSNGTSISVPTGATAGLAATGGSSGIIIDNTVASGTRPGASQVYFSTLSSGNCSTSGGTGGCAVQASQSAP
jgi:hypothetical protein